jgi:drug/metabolite transporter (DMT)-like permease
MMTPRRVGAVAAALLAALLFGASAAATKPLLSTVDPQLLAGLLYLGAALATLPSAILARSRLPSPDRASVLRLSGAILAGGVVAPVLLLVGLSKASASSVALWIPLETVATALLAWALFHEHLGRREMAGLALVVVAGVLAAGPPSEARWISAFFVLLACVAWGLDNNLSALIDGLTPAQSTLAKGLAAGTVNLVIAVARGAEMPPAVILVQALGIGIVCYGFSIALYLSAAQQLGAARSQALFATSPFFGAALAWLLLQDSVSAWQIAAAAVLALGLSLLMTARHAHEHAHEAMSHVHWHRHDDGHHAHDHDGIVCATWHCHPHAHEPQVHAHPHLPDLHHRHVH